VANFANDVVGDIAATLAGALGISLALQLARRWEFLDLVALNVLVTSVIASLTVTGKAVGKRIAVGRANEVVFLVGQLLAVFSRSDRKTEKNKRQANQPTRR
jgi:hypothetical protein